MGFRDVAARPLLVVAVGLTLVGLAVAPAARARADEVTTEVAGTVTAAVRTPVTSPPVAIALDEPLPTTTTATTAPPATTATTLAAAPVTTAPAAPTTAAASPPTSSPSPTTSPPATSPPPTAPPTTAAAPPPPSSRFTVDTGCERMLFDQTNQARAAEGLAPLAFESRAHGVARGWSEEMASQGRMSHNPRLGSDLDAAGVPWTTAGENVGHGDVNRIFGLWMGSTTHRANIVSRSFTAMAVGCVHDGVEMWVTQTFVG